MVCVFHLPIGIKKKHNTLQELESEMDLGPTGKTSFQKDLPSRLFMCFFPQNITLWYFLT